MSIPVAPIRRETVTISGVDYSVRALTRTEAFKMQTLAADPEGVEAFILASGLDATVDEANEWRAATPNEDVLELGKAIVRLSGLEDEGSPKD